MNFFKKILKIMLVKCVSIYYFHDDKELINLFIKKGDEYIFDEMVNRYIDKVYLPVFRTTGNKEMTEDIIQEINSHLVSKSQKLETFRGDSSFSTLLYRISTNAALMKLRSEKKFINDRVIDDNSFLEESRSRRSL